MSCGAPATAVNAAGKVDGVIPSLATNSPSPPDTLRMFPSKSSTWSKMADQFSARCKAGLPGANVACKGTVRRGPVAKIQTTLSVNPNGWQDEHAPQPLFDMRPVMAGCPGACGSNSPTDELNNALPICTLSSSVPAWGRFADVRRAISASGACVKSSTETSREM